MRRLYFLLIILLLACKKREDNSESKVKEIWGKRLSIHGDFNGDKKIDTLEERFINTLTNLETNKYYNIDYDSMVDLTVKKKPMIMLVSKRNIVDTLKIAPTSGQIFGLNYLVNIGDNNSNSRDEIGLIVDFADWSNINSFKIYELNDSSRWTLNNTFEIRDFDDVDSIFRKDNGQLIIRTYNLLGQTDSIIKIK